ncbi:MAG: hypothetical protein ABWU84_12010, partial [Pyrobaculum sp.]|uniref:hypothetical protein n=1 Tax=Pyrobaculum sp. TaxID=2004705 RepID=UPI003EECD5A1
VYNLIYVGEVYPFNLRRLLPVLLSSRGAKTLKDFFTKAREANSGKKEKDLEKIDILIKELKQPSQLEILNPSRYYVVYRCDRAFTACVIKPPDNAVLDSHLAALECPSGDMAYYYAGVLNYLAYKVIESERAFIHHQFARPALAIAVAGLSWKNVEDGVRRKVAQLARELSQKCRVVANNQSVALKKVARCREFQELKKLLDGIVDPERLKKVLGLVSER